MIHGIIALLFALGCLVAVVLAFVFWIWMLIDAIKNPRLDGTQRIVWVLVIIFLHALGALIYFLAGRSA
jgi:cytochrome c oxidase assembly factor CtaG